MNITRKMAREILKPDRSMKKLWLIRRQNDNAISFVIDTKREQKEFRRRNNYDNSYRYYRFWMIKTKYDCTLHKIKRRVALSRSPKWPI